MKYAVSVLWCLVTLSCTTSPELSDSTVADMWETHDGAGTDVGMRPRVTECGEPTFAPALGLRRYPYVQSVTPTSVRIAWTSTVEGAGFVELAGAEGQWRRTPAVREAFPIKRTDDTEPYWAYDATVEDLHEGRSWCYRVIQDGEVIASGLKVTTAWTDPDRPLRILAFGDSGDGSADQAAVRDAFMAHEFDVFLHMGDMAYDSGTFREFEAFVFDMYRDLLHQIPMWPTMGNHEYKTFAGQPYLDVYYLPEQAVNADEQERYYSFDYGDVHLVSIESNDGPLVLAELLQLGGDEGMLSWLKADLAASDATWKIAFFHHPPFSSSERPVNTLVRGNLLPILEEGGVDLVLTGHDHHYERTHPIWQEQVAEGDPRALTYIVAGAAGAGLRPATGDWWTAAVNDKKHSFVSLTIEGCTLTGKTLASDGEVIDEFTLDGCDP